MKVKNILLINIIVGDGTTSVVVLAGELLKNCEKLIRKDIHPNLICEQILSTQEVIENILELSCQNINLSEKVFKIFIFLIEFR